MKKLIYATALVSIFFTGCNVNQGIDDYKTEEVFQSKYDKRLQENPNYKLNVKDLNLWQDIKDDSIFCYSTVSTPKEKMQKLVEGIRSEIPLECNGGIDTNGNYSCLLEKEILDTTAKENSIDVANGGSSKTLAQRANENGYNGKFVVGDSFIQNDLSEKAMVLALENKMKKDPKFCSYVVSKKTKDLGVGYEEKDGKRYWTIVFGDATE